MTEKKIKPPKEWFRQAEYDLETAKALFDSGRYIYTIFMCHLSIEKALKALFAKKFNQNPPKTHDLIYLIKKIELEINQDFIDYFKILNEISIPTRYPEELSKLLKEFTKERTKNILKQSRDAIIWLKTNLSR